MQVFEAEERAALVAAVQRLLRDKSTEADVRRTMETERGYDPELWRQLADMGLTGLIVDADCGGSGCGPVELELVMEEIGAAHRHRRLGRGEDGARPRAGRACRRTGGRRAARADAELFGSPPVYRSVTWPHWEPDDDRHA